MPVYPNAAAAAQPQSQHAQAQLQKLTAIASNENEGLSLSANESLDLSWNTLAEEKLLELGTDGLRRYAFLNLRSSNITANTLHAVVPLVYRTLRGLNAGFNPAFDRPDAPVALEPMSMMLQLEQLNMESCKLTDACMPPLRHLVNLKVLILYDNNITDGALVYLAGLVQLEELSLGKKITDAGMVHLRPFVKLIKLNLGGNKGISDVGAQHLAVMKNMRQLILRETKITDASLMFMHDMLYLSELNLKFCHGIERNANGLAQYFRIVAKQQPQRKGLNLTISK